MAGENILFRIEQVVVDGQALAIEDGSGELTGAAGFENEGVASASGDHYVRRKRVVPQFKVKLQFGKTVNPDQFSKQTNVQISAKDLASGRRAVMNRCAFGSLGTVGGGSVELTYLVLSPVQWLG